MAPTEPADVKESCLRDRPPGIGTVTYTRQLYEAYAGTADTASPQSEEGSGAPAYFGDNIDAATFDQILEMDDDEDEREFSRSIVEDFFTQAQNSFDDMATKLDEKDLPALSALGHFLKGSSATLGLTKVKDSCEKIQHLGARMDEAGEKPEPDDGKTLERLKAEIKIAKTEYQTAEKLLKRFFGIKDSADA